MDTSSMMNTSNNTTNKSRRTREVYNHADQLKDLYGDFSDLKRKGFLDALFNFMAERNTPINKLPIMDRKVLDLYELFNLVLERGGFLKVIDNKLWQEVVKALDLPASITSAAFTLRTQYYKYLYPYEHDTFGLSTWDQVNEAIDKNRRSGDSPRNAMDEPIAPTLDMVQMPPLDLLLIAQQAQMQQQAFLEHMLQQQAQEEVKRRQAAAEEAARMVQQAALQSAAELAVLRNQHPSLSEEQCQVLLTMISHMKAMNAAVPNNEEAVNEEQDVESLSESMGDQSPQRNLKRERDSDQEDEHSHRHHAASSSKHSIAQITPPQNENDNDSNTNSVSSDTGMELVGAAVTAQNVQVQEIKQADNSTQLSVTLSLNGQQLEGIMLTTTGDANSPAGFND